MTNHSLRFPALIGAALAAVVVTVGAQAPALLDNVKKLLADKACVGCFLAEASLSAAALEGADLTGANLFEANLYFANLAKANLTNAQLGKANLRKARLKGAILTGADLTGADLHWATDADFTGAITTATTTCPNGAAGPCL